MCSLTNYLTSAIFSFIKRCIFYLYIPIYLRRKKRFENFEGFSLDLAKIGLFPTPFEISIDRPQTLLPGKNGFNSMVFWGVDSSGNSILLHINRKNYRKAEVWLYLNLAGVDEFQLPIHSDTNVYNVDETSFSAAGLKFEVIEPMRKWRISFSGLLRKGNDASSKDSLQVVSFSFIWIPMSKAYDYNSDFHSDTIVNAIAQSAWTSQLFKTLHSYNYDKYEQCGQMQGTVTFPQGEETVLLLRGSRTHSFGEFNHNDIVQYIDIKGYMEDGVVLHLHMVKIVNGIECLVQGFMAESTSWIVPISSCDISLDDWVEKKDFSFTFHADSSPFTVNVEVQPGLGLTLLNGDHWSKRVWSQPVKLLMNNKKTGSAIVQFCCKNTNNSWSLPKKRESVPLISFKESPVLRNSPLVVDVDHSECKNPLLVGGKGASIALLTSVSSHNPQFPLHVPKAICITTQAYRSHVRMSSNFKTLLENLENIAWKRIEGDLETACERVIDSVINSPMPLEVQDLIEKSMWKLFGSSWELKLFAVRSSAVGEDSDELSSAGQNATYLGVKGLSQVIESVLKCWASQFSSTAVKYKRQNGQLLDPGMGVVIQEMVPAEFSGVMFTQGPISGNRNQITITASYGLGESVVSAAVEPDTFLLTKFHDDTVTINKKILGKKDMKIVLRDVGTKTESVSRTRSDQYCISDKTALQLGKVGVIVEQWLGGPRDIEWAISNGLIYLLQARPITSGDRETEFELMHEFDGVVRTDNEYHTVANLGEVFPECVTPLTISVICKIMDVVGQKSFDRAFPNTCDVNPYHHRLIVVFRRRMMFNCIDNLYRGSVNMSIGMIRALEISLFGRVMNNSAIMFFAKERYRNRSSTSIMLKFVMAFIILRNNQLVKEVEKKIENFVIQTNFFTSQETYYSITQSLPQLFMCSKYFADINAVISIWNFLAVSLLINLENDSSWNNDFYGALSKLLICGSYVESADVPTSLQSVAEAIAADKECDKFTNQLNEQEALDWLKDHRGKAGEKFHEFLTKHGHRCLLEYDFESRPWIDDPTYLISVLKTILKSPNIPKERKRPVDVRETLNSLSIPLPSWKKILLQFIVSKCRKSVAVREQCKSYMIYCIHQLRRGYQDLAKQMLLEGRIPDTQLIYYFTHTEIGSLLQTRSPRLISKAFRRKNLHPHLKKLRFPEIVKGIPEPEKEIDLVSLISNGVKLKGTPVCQGIAKGIAKVVCKLEEASNIQSGDILITHSIDIAWSAYFPLLAGIVTELGGIISHGAVIAREYGLPCLVGAQKSTQLFRSGDRVILNATSGYLLKENI